MTSRGVVLALLLVARGVAAEDVLPLVGSDPEDLGPYRTIDIHKVALQTPQNASTCNLDDARETCSSGSFGSGPLEAARQLHAEVVAQRECDPLGQCEIVSDASHADGSVTDLVHDPGVIVLEVYAPAGVAGALPVVFFRTGTSPPSAVLTDHALLNASYGRVSVVLTGYASDVTLHQSAPIDTAILIAAYEWVMGGLRVSPAGPAAGAPPLPTPDRRRVLFWGGSYGSAIATLAVSKVQSMRTTVGLDGSVRSLPDPAGQRSVVLLPDTTARRLPPVVLHVNDSGPCDDNGYNDDPATPELERDAFGYRIGNEASALIRGPFIAFGTTDDTFIPCDRFRHRTAERMNSAPSSRKFGMSVRRSRHYDIFFPQSLAVGAPRPHQLFLRFFSATTAFFLSRQCNPNREDLRYVRSFMQTGNPSSAYGAHQAADLVETLWTERTPDGVSCGGALLPRFVGVNTPFEDLAPVLCE